MDSISNVTLTPPTSNQRFKMMECSKISVYCFFYSFHIGSSEHLNKINEIDSWLENWTISSGHTEMKLKKSPNHMVLTGTRLTTFDITISDSGSYELSSILNDSKLLLAPIITDKIVVYFDYTLKTLSNSDGIEDESINVVATSLGYIRSEGMGDTKYAFLLYKDGTDFFLESL